MVVPIDVLDHVLEETWRIIRDEYDVTADLPDLEVLFAGADLTSPHQSAEAVVVNMLTEVICCVSRFSPWYNSPARTFGLLRIREATTGRGRWVLAPEAEQRWGDVLSTLEDNIQANVGVFLAVQHVDDLLDQALPEEPCVVAVCSCDPPHQVLIKESALDCAEIICGECHAAFRPTARGR
jgi:hypothetical protein